MYSLPAPVGASLLPDFKIRPEETLPAWAWVATGVVFMIVGLAVYQIGNRTFPFAANHSTASTATPIDITPQGDATEPASLLVASRPAISSPNILNTPASPMINASPMQQALVTGTIGRGDGYERAIARQLSREPGQFAPTIYADKGAIDQQRAVHRWAGVAAHRIAKDNGLVDPRFGEVRVKKPGTVAVVLQVKGKRVDVVQYDVSRLPRSDTEHSTWRVLKVPKRMTGSMSVHAYPAPLYFYTG